jgi:hypothetical protein
MIIITGASQNHYKSLINMIHSFVKIYGNQENANLIVYDLGIEEESWKSLENIFIEIKNISYKKFDFSVYPEYFDIRINAGEYAWKSAIIYECCNDVNNDNIIIWMDSGNLISEKLDRIVNHLNSNFIYSCVSSNDIEKWVHPKTIDYMNLKDKVDVKKRMRNAACIAINYEKDWIKDLVKEWTTLCGIKDCIAPEGSSRINHRQDQSVFTLLYYEYKNKYNFASIDEYIGYTVHNDCD